MNRVKLALLSIGALLFVACGGGGGGGSSSLPVKPSDIANPQNIVKDTLKKGEEKAKEKVEEKKQDLLNKGKETISKIEDQVKENALGLLPKKEEEKQKYPIPTDTKVVTGKTQKIAILDSDFLTHKQELEGKYPGIQILEKKSSDPVPDGHYHGEKVLELMADGKEFMVIAGSIGERAIDGVYPNIELYEEILERFGEQKLKVFNQSWALTKTMAAYEPGNERLYIDLMPLVRLSPKDPDVMLERDLIARGKRLADFYQKAVDQGGLFVWAAGNLDGKGNTLSDASLQAGLPKFRNKLEAGWISVVGIQERSEDGRTYNTHYTNHLAYAGEAARWSISANGDRADKGGRGSSYAAPRVARAVALVSEKFPWMTNNQVRQTLFTTSDAVEVSEKGKRRIAYDPDPKYGWGMLNEERALKGPGAFLESLVKANGAKDYFYDWTTYRWNFEANVPEGMESYFENDIYGDTGLKKSGKGSLHLTGNNTYDGKTILQDGDLHIYQNHDSNVFVEKNGNLHLYPKTKIGYNSDRELLSNKNVDNAGTVKVTGKGATIGGNYIAREGSTTEADFSSKVTVHGKIDLQGGKLQVLKNQYLADAEENVLLEGKAIEGKFDELVINGLREVSAKEENGKLLVRAERANVAKYAEDGNGTLGQVSHNMEETFRELDAKVRKGEAGVTELQAAAALQNMSKEEFLDASAKLSGEIYASAQALSLAQAQNTNRVLSHRMAETGEDRVWANFLASDGSLKEKGYISADTKLLGGQVGLDKKIGEHSLLGLSFSHSEAKANFDAYAGKSESEGYGLSLYGKHSFPKQYYVAGRVGVDRFVSRVERDLLDDKAGIQRGKIKHRDYMFSSYVEAGKEGKYWTPYLGFSYDVLRRGSFQEKNAAWGIEAEHKNYLSPHFVYGLRFQKDYKKYRLSASLSQAILLGSRDLDFQGKYIASDVIHEYRGIRQARVTTWAGVGVAREFSNQVSIYGNLDLRWEDRKKKDLLFSTGIQYRF